MRRLTLTGVWLIALLLAITVTWQIVSAADDQVSERPIAPMNVAAPVITGLQTTTTSTSPPRSTTIAAPGTTSTTPSSTSPSTPTTAEAAWQTRSVQTVGGTTLVRYRPGEVIYQSATPAPGYQVEVEMEGPPEVRVDFESQSHKVQVEAAWDGGDLRVSVSEEDED